MVDVVVNQGNDTLEARGIARIDFAICGDKMVAPLKEVIEIRN